MNKIATITALLFGACVFTAFKTETRKPVIGAEVKDFSLKSADGKTVSLADYKNAHGFIIIFTCNHCPFAKLYTSRFNALNSEYAPKGVPLIAINPMDSVVYEDETLQQMQKRAKKENYNFAYLQDDKQEVVKQFNASHTPQAFIIWKEDGKWVIKYAGAIDNNGQEPDKATSYIKKGVDELLGGNEVSTKETVSFGCAIYYRK